MPIESSLSLDVKPSYFSLCISLVVHILALLSIYLVNDFGLAGALIKAVLVLSVLISFMHFLAVYKTLTCLYFKSGNLVDLVIGKNKYTDLQLLGSSYISTLFTRLVFLDEHSGSNQYVKLYPGSLSKQHFSQLRARLKLFSDSSAV